MTEVKCGYCHNRGYYFFWENNPRRQKWKMECPHCAPMRLAVKKPPPKRISDTIIEVEF